MLACVYLKAMCFPRGKMGKLNMVFLISSSSCKYYVLYFPFFPIYLYYYISIIFYKNIIKKIYRYKRNILIAPGGGHPCEYESGKVMLPIVVAACVGVTKLARAKEEQRREQKRMR